MNFYFRWYGKKIFHMLMSHDEFDRLYVKSINENTRKNIKETLDQIKVKGPGDVPTESARNSRKGLRTNSETMSRSAGSNTIGGGGSVSGGGGAPLLTNMTSMNPRVVRNMSETVRHASTTSSAASSAKMRAFQPAVTARMDAQTQDYIRAICAQMRHSDFRERIDAIEKFQVMCEMQTDLVAVNIVPVSDRLLTK